MYQAIEYVGVVELVDTTVLRPCHLREGFSGGIAVKWNESVYVQKILPVIAYICAVAYLILSAFELCDIHIVPRAVACALFGIFFLSQSLIQKSRKKKIWGYCLTAGWFLLSLMHCF